MVLIERTDDKPGEDYVPASTNPIENAAEAWTTLRAEYLDLLGRNRHQETEIERKDKRIEDLEAALVRLQADRDRAVVVSTELKAGLIQAGDILTGLMRRADAAFRAFRETDAATTIADTVRKPAGESETASAGAPEGAEPVRYEVQVLTGTVRPHDERLPLPSF